MFGMINNSEVKRALADTRLADVCFGKERAQEDIFNLGSFLSLSTFHVQKVARAHC